jgi:uncharacterized membrane protein
VELLLFVLLVIFVVLKVSCLVSWSWFIVLSPAGIWILLALAMRVYCDVLDKMQSRKYAKQLEERIKKQTDLSVLRT